MTTSSLGSNAAVLWRNAGFWLPVERPVKRQAGCPLLPKSRRIGASMRRFGDRAASVEGTPCGRMNRGGDSSGEDDALAFGGGPRRVPGLVYRNRFCPIANRFSLIPETASHRRRPGCNRSRCGDGGSQEGIFRSTGEWVGLRKSAPLVFMVWTVKSRWFHGLSLPVSELVPRWLWRSWLRGRRPL